MEKRKLKILTYFNDILEEKLTLERNLEKIINQVYSYVDCVQNFSEEIKQKDWSLISSHELGVLKKLTDINYDLENIIEGSPLEHLKIPEKEYDSDAIVPEACADVDENGIEQEMLELKNFVSSQRVKSPVESVLETALCSSEYILDQISSSYNIETSITIFDNDIQKEFRDTLKKYSQKFGVNAECISSMKDYYEKPSVSCMKDFFDKPSSSQNADYTNHQVGLTLEPEPTNEFEMPEKDTNRSIKCETEDIDESTIILPDELSLKPTNLDKPMPNICENIIDSACVVEPAPQNIIYCPDVSSCDTSSDMEVFQNGDSPTETSAKASHSNCPMNDDLELNIIIDKPNKTENGISEPKKNVYTALEKLNNTTFFDRKEEVLNKMLPAVSPDLKLKPTESKVIKNKFEVKNKLKKKKNKKGKGDMKDDCIYELRRKPAPTVGMDCAFSHIESPSEFYIHIVDEESACIDLLTDQINEYFSEATHKYASKEEAFGSIGTYCFTFISEYNGWYRAKILEWYLESKSDDVLLQLVDYGNKRRVSYKNVQKMTKIMAECPMLAIRCHLPLMYPPHSTHLNKLTEWPPETIDALLNLGGFFAPVSQENKFFRVLYAQEEGDSVAIDVYNFRDAEPEQSIGQILLDVGLAVQIITEVDEENLELEEFVQDIDTLEKADNINEAVIGYDPRDEARICRFTKSDGTCFKGKNCKLEHIRFPKDGFTTDKEAVFKEAMDTLQLPSIGEVIILLIVGYRDVCNFFAQIVRKPHKEKYRSLEYIIDMELYTLLGTMNNAKTVKTFETFKVAPAIGEVVIVRHKYNKKWLRAIVRERVMQNNYETEEYQVFMVDFGDYMQLPLSDLRKMQPHFLQLPFQAVECYIDNFRARNDCDRKKAEQFFYKNILYHNFGAVAMSESLPLKVALKTFNGSDIGKKLVEMGFAEERIYDKNPIDECGLQLY